jgi:sugar lactone lactonase YvrE
MPQRRSTATLGVARIWLLVAALLSPLLAAAGDPALKTGVVPAATPIEDYEETVRKGDLLYADGNYRDAVLMYERAWRIAYNNKLKTDSAALDKRLAKARKARDEKKAVPKPAPPAAPKTAEGPSREALAEYEESVRKGDSLCEAGNYFDAVLAYERAARIAYNNRKIDSSALDERLAKARKARDEGEKGEKLQFLELTAPQASSVRSMKPSEVCGRTGICVDGMNEEDRWRIANPFLPGDHRFFSMIYGAACSSDGTIYVAANGVVSAERTRRRPRSNGDWYADNGHGLWRVAPDGRVTAFSVGPYGFYPPPGLRPEKKAFCDAGVLEVSPFGPDRWGGIVVSPKGDVYVSDTEYHTILKLQGDGTVLRVAGGGEKACVYEPWNKKRESGHRDGPGDQALFKNPEGLALDREGNLLVADWGNCALRKIDPSGNVTTVQKGCFANPGDKGNNRKKILHSHVVIDPQGRPVVGGSFTIPGKDIYSNVHRIHPDGRVEQLLSGSFVYPDRKGGLGVGFLNGLAYLPDGRLLIADAPNNLLRTVDGKRLNDWLGAFSHEAGKEIDGRPPNVRLRGPGRLCVTGDGTLIVAPSKPRSGPVRKVDGRTREASTWVY